MSAETAATPAEPGSKPKRTRRLRTWLGELSTTVKAIGGVAAAIAAIVGLVFLFFPDLRPAPTSDEGSATLSKPTLEHPVTYRQYLDRVEIPHDRSTEAELARPGVLAGVVVTIKGYRNQGLPLRWYVLDVGTHDIVDQQSRKHVLTADRNETPVAWPFWVELPEGKGPFKIVLQIYPPNAKPGETGVLPLAEAETEPFPGTTPARAGQRSLGGRVVKRARRSDMSMSPDRSARAWRLRQPSRRARRGEPAPESLPAGAPPPREEKP